MNENIKKLEEELNLFRSKIDKVDIQLKTLLIERFDLIDKIIQIKKLLGADYFDSVREFNIYENILKDLPDDKIKVIQNIFRSILDESRAFQKKKLNSKNPSND